MEEFLSVNDPFKVRLKHLNLILVEILTRSVLFFFLLLFLCVFFNIRRWTCCTYFQIIVLLHNPHEL